MTDARDIDCPKCAKSGDDCGEHSPSWEELVDYWKNEALSLRKQLEDAREAVKGLLYVHDNGAIMPAKDCVIAWGAAAAFAREALKGKS